MKPVTLTARGRLVASVLVGAAWGFLAGASVWPGYLVGHLDIVKVGCVAGGVAVAAALVASRFLHGGAR